MEGEIVVEGRTWLKRCVAKIPRWLKWLLAVLLVLVVAGGFFAVRAKNSPVPVKVSKITRQDIQRNVFASGRLEAVKEQPFFTPVDSTLMELKVKIGDRVKKGDILGRLDTLELARLYKNAVAELSGKEAELANAQAVSDQLGLKVAETQYSKAKNHYNRIETLFKAGAANAEEREAAQVDLVQAENAYQEAAIKAGQNASVKQISSLRDQVELARQEVAQAKERLDMATFTATIDGVVTSVGAKEGNRVLEGTELLVIGDDNLLEVTADVTEIDAGSLKIGQPVSISSIALPGQKFTGEITRIGGAAVSKESSTGETINVPVTIKIKGDKGNLRIGYSVDLSIRTMEEKGVTVVPFDAVINRHGKKTVYVVSNSAVKAREIKTRRGNELYDIVISGLKPGEKIVVNPGSGLKNGQKVTVRGEAK